MIVSVVAASSGSTISALPFCHWPIRNSPFGLPSSFQLSGAEDRLDLVLRAASRRA